MTQQKIELSDLDGYDWNWLAKYGDAVTAELAEAFTASIVGAMPDIPPLRAQMLAIEYASERAGELLRITVQSTRERVGELVAGTIERGDSLQTLQKALREDFAFSRSRAEMVAQTETATAHGQGAKGAAMQQGRTEKRWILNTDVDPICVGNAAQGWIKIGDPFTSGVDTIPAHPRCQCNTIYRTVEPPEVVLQEVHCPTCDKRLPVNNVARGTEAYCKRCSKTFEVA